MPTENQPPNRRGFIATSAKIAAAGSIGAVSLPRLAMGYHHGVNDTLKIGLVGCGGRGTGAVVNAAAADSNVQIVALADAFTDRMDSCLEELKTQRTDNNVPLNINVADDHKFSGFDCCEKLVASDVDVVLLATPPHFRPAHLRACVDANKHVFCEKPVGVDVPGVKSVLESCQIAAGKGLSVVSGLCWRYDTNVKEMVRRIQDGAIGEIRSIQENYLTGTLWHRGDNPKWSRMEYQLRNWLYYNWLSGDHIAEQHIHSLDKALWLMGDKPPTSCYGTGGRLVRTDPMWGNVYDHFSCVFEWDDSDVKTFSHCRQMADCFSDVDDYIVGTKGTAKILKGEINNADGKQNVKQPGALDMYVSEHIELFKSIRAGQPINNGEYMSHSTLMALMGRDACYTGKRIKFEDYMKSEVRLGPDSYEWNDYEPDPVAKPGTKF